MLYFEAVTSSIMETIAYHFQRLRKYYKFPYSNLKNEQKEVIRNTLKKQDTFAVLPTGFGKSACYVLPPLIMDMVMLIIINRHMILNSNT